MNDHLVNLFLTMPLPETGVSFTSSDLALNNLVAKAEKLAAANIVQFSPDMQALIEGGGYSSVYTETQPMGGEMYAKRNPRVALNNQLSEELGDGKAGYWHEQAQAVRQALKANLWRPENGAAYDKDRNNQWMETLTLTHNNLRCMHYGVFDQEMADEFISRHLLNHTVTWASCPCLAGFVTHGQDAHATGVGRGDTPWR